MKEAIAFGAGIVTSLVLDLVPCVRKRWANHRFKVLTLLIIHVGTGMVVWALSCVLGLNLGIYVPCGYQGLAEMGWTGVVAFTSSQLTYHTIMERLPQVRARKLQSAIDIITRARVGNQ